MHRVVCETLNWFSFSLNFYTTWFHFKFVNTVDPEEMSLHLDKDNKDQDEFHPLKYDKKNF